MEKNRFSISPVDDKKNCLSMGASIITKPLKGNADMENGTTHGETLFHETGAKRKRSLVQLTREALPRMENYRNSRRAHKRPSLADLHGDQVAPREEDKPQLHKEKSPTPEFPGFVSIKLGWIQGVLIPCLLNIWGVMLFLRISWIVGQAGIGLSLLIILISSVVCVITTLSMSAITTNGEVKGGGIYYIISRSLGPEFGASVGIIFAFANAVAASMNTIGFCDSLNNLLKDHGVKIIDNGIQDVRIIGTIALIVMCVICAVGMDWESKAQNILVVVIVGAMAALVIGALVGPLNDVQVAQGFVGLNLQTITQNWKPNFRRLLPSGEKIEQNFFTIFGIFFPSVTGIQAGANISGDLKDPATAIPKGTLLSLLISMLSYALMVVFSGAAALREATGDVHDVHNLTALTNCSEDNPCAYGLLNSYYVMELMSIWGPLIYAGCFAATLSTALTNLLSVPRLIQALGIDGIYPGLVYFSKGYGKHGEPYRGYVLAFLVSLVFLLIGDLDTIAPLISNFYLTSYALINFCAFHAALVSPLGWRPTFKFYNVWLSLLGFLLCVGVMLLLNWITSLITAAIFFTLYLIVTYRKPDVNWGSSTQAQSYKVALASVWGLARTGEHVKNYWPQLLVLAGQPHCRPALVDLASLITKAGSLMFVAEITEDKLSYRERSARTQAGDEWLRRRKVRAFTLNVNGFGFELGARALLQAAGLGRLAPNVLLMGYKADWATAPRHHLLSYFNVLHTAFENRLAVAILRLPGGLDYSSVTTAETGPGAEAGTPLTANSSCGDLRLRQLQNILHADSDLDIHISAMSNRPVFKDGLLSTSRSFVVNEKPKKDQKLSDIPEKPSKELLSQMNLFQIKQTDGTVDVWWLYDDGGLTMLLPYVIAQRSHWGRVRLRVFALASRNTDIEQEKNNMAHLLAKFRIEFASLTIVPDISEQPQPETTSLFNDIIKNFTKEFDESGSGSGIEEGELSAQADKTKRQLRLRELLLANSSAASLVVMSLPMPRKGSVSAALYMAWLEVMSRDLPPTLFVRGNQTSVLTVYS